MSDKVTTKAQLGAAALAAQNVLAALAKSVMEAIEEVLDVTAKEFPPVELSIPAAGWTGEGPYIQEIAVDGVTADMENLTLHPINMNEPEARRGYEAAVQCLAPNAESLDGGVRLIAYTLPAQDFVMILKGVRT